MAGGTQAVMPLWLSVASAFLGLAEVPGPGSNPVIAKWAKDLGVPYADDDEAWCALFMNRVLAACHLPVSGKTYDLLRAKSFVDYGVPLLLPTLGAILVFTRPTGGHVGFYLGETAMDYRVRGGNTANAVGDTWIAKSRLIAVRWPIAVAGTLAAPIMLAANGEPASTDEA